jgi:hypothetical protein
MDTRLRHATLAVVALALLTAPVMAVTIDTWEQNTDYPVLMAEQSGADLNGVHYVIGGDSFATGEVEETVRYYDAATQTWQQAPSMQTPRRLAGAAEHNNDLWVIGGYTGGLSDTGTTSVEVYDPGTDSWTSRANVPLTADGATAAVANGTLYVLDDDGDMVSWNESSTSWESEPTNPLTRGVSASATGYNGDLYVSGGFSDENGMVRFNTTSETWDTTLSDMPVSKTGHEMVTVGSELWIYGSGDAVYSYDPASDTYSSEASIPVSHSFFAGSYSDGYIYSTGGAYDNASYRYVTPFAIDFYNVTGVVRDDDNNRLDGVEITVVNVSQGTEVGTDTTTSIGRYDVGQLQNGTYEIFANKSGYVNDSQEFTVNGQDREIDFTLRSFNASLRLDVRAYLEHGQSTNYEVIATLENGTRLDVTDQATVTSGDTNVITVDQATNRLTATEDRSVNQRVFISADYTTPDGKTFETGQNVTVANATVENVEILPTGPRVSASFEDTTIQVIIVAVMGGIAASWVASSFAGLSAVTIIMTIGWFAGRVGDGMLLVTIVTSVFIGLNVATNVDMTMMRGR